MGIVMRVSSILGYVIRGRELQDGEFIAVVKISPKFQVVG